MRGCDSVGLGGTQESAPEHPAQGIPKEALEEPNLHLSSKKNSSFAVKFYMSERFA